MKIQLKNTLYMMTSLVCMLFLPFFNTADAAFGKIDLNGTATGGTVSKGTGVDEGIFSDMNALLMVVLGIAGFVVVACIIFAGAKLATAQGNPQARTQGFIGLGMAFIGGWVVYKCLEIAGWIKGFGGTKTASSMSNDPNTIHNVMTYIAPFV